MSWAAIAKSEPVKAAPVVVIEKERQSVAVIDANAIINGNGLLNLMRSAEKIVTIPEVLREVRDKQSRAALEALPFKITTQEPSEESVKAGTLITLLFVTLHLPDFFSNNQNPARLFRQIPLPLN
jgi:RNA-binding protein NOB1